MTTNFTKTLIRARLVAVKDALEAVNAQIQKCNEDISRLQISKQDWVAQRDGLNSERQQLLTDMGS